MLDPVFDLNQKLRNRLSSLVLRERGDAPMRVSSGPSAVVSRCGALPGRAQSLNVVVTGNEVTNQHGTGPLVQRVSQGWTNVFAIRARNDWGGNQDFGDWHVCLSRGAATRAGAFRSVLGILRGHNVARVLSVPFLPDEFYTSIALQECFGAKLAVYLMDDQNVATKQIPDSLMREFLERCSLRLATHPELQLIYERKYEMPFHVLPAIVPACLISPTETAAAFGNDASGALIGSFWDQSWFDRLCSVLSRCNRKIDWFGNNKSPWLNLSMKSLAKAGITAHGVIPEARLAGELAKYPFVIVPAGALDGKESNAGVARLSLPGRILFAVATSHTPVLLIGNSRTCGAHFVNHFGVGEVVPYNAADVAAAMERMSQPEAQMRMRHAAAKISATLSDAGISEWLRRSIDLGAPIDNRFKEFFAGYDADIDPDLDGRHAMVAGTR